MAIGPGKYDDLATLVREGAEAAAVIVLVLGGNEGSGFSMQAPVEIVAAIPTLLRRMADDMEQE
jgi:hypothetical protein